jgi:hypothetical protein
VNLTQMHKRVKRDRDKQVITVMADRFAARADAAFVAGRLADARQLRDTADWLRAAPLKQATAFLGKIVNAQQEAVDAQVR